jgi:hypothetical protein
MNVRENFCAPHGMMVKSLNLRYSPAIHECIILKEGDVLIKVLKRTEMSLRSVIVCAIAPQSGNSPFDKQTEIGQNESPVHVTRTSTG